MLSVGRIGVSPGVQKCAPNTHGKTSRGDGLTEATGKACRFATVIVLLLEAELAEERGTGMSVQRRFIMVTGKQLNTPVREWLRNA